MNGAHITDFQARVKTLFSSSRSVCGKLKQSVAIISVQRDRLLILPADVLTVIGMIFY
ncbi:hypothetical protein [Mixta theicola]|uniref:hypothetical protein n=1 Tax=Mixta theicola TaxID=1458355 RepID=UPI0013FDF765|nr:hypothetical protein [Mixta theicola]